MVLLFVVMPFFKSKIKNNLVNHFAASHYIIYSFLVYLFIGQVSRWLPKLGMPVNESLRGNHQEFEELILYYIILLFVYEVAVSKKALFTAKGKLQRTSD
jgi:glycopeptide antibiotics resistance protein